MQHTIKTISAAVKNRTGLSSVECIFQIDTRIRFKVRAWSGLFTDDAIMSSYEITTHNDNRVIVPLFETKGMLSPDDIKDLADIAGGQRC